MKIGHGELFAGRALLVVLMAFTLLPFISIFMTALHPSGTVPGGLDWPAHPQWGNFVEAFKVANMSTLIVSSVRIVLMVVPFALIIATMAGFAIGQLRIPGSGILLALFVFGLTLPFQGIIIPIYILERALHIYNTKFAIALPLIALYMPFGVFWMRAHFVNMPSEISEAARVDGATTWDLFRQNPPPARAGSDRFPWDTHVHLDVESVSPRACARRGSVAANDGRCTGSVPGSLRHQCPTAVCRNDHHPCSYIARICVIPASDYQGTAPGRGQGLIVALEVKRTTGVFSFRII